MTYEERVKRAAQLARRADAIVNASQDRHGFHMPPQLCDQVSALAALAQLHLSIAAVEEAP